MYKPLRAAIRDGVTSFVGTVLVTSVLVLAHIGAQHQWSWVREYVWGHYDPTWTVAFIGLAGIALGVADAVHTYIGRPRDPRVVADWLMSAKITCPGCFNQGMPVCHVICDDCGDDVKRGEYLSGYSVGLEPNEQSRSSQEDLIGEWSRDRDERDDAIRAISTQLTLR